MKDYHFLSIDGESGLSQNTVKSIVQDSRGFMWFGTRNKLNRYDGISIKVFDCTDPIARKTNNSISSLYEDENENLWLGTDNGVFIFNSITETFSFVSDSTSQGLVMSDWVSDIQSDLDRNLWIVVPNQGLFRYTLSSKQLYHYKIGDTEFPDRGNPQSICIEQNGKVWVGTNGGGVYLYNKVYDTFTQYLGDKEHGRTLLKEKIYTMCDYGEYLILGIHEGKLLKFNKRKNTIADVDFPEIQSKIIRHVACFNNELWVGTQEGLYIINEATREITHLFEDPLHPHSLSDNLVIKIYKDREEGIWVTTNFGGANYLPKRSLEFEKYIPRGLKDGIKSKRIREMKEAIDGLVWIATEDAGVNIFDPQTKQFRQLGQDVGNPLHYNNVLSLLVDKNRMWVGFFKNGLDIVTLPSYSTTHYDMKQPPIDETSIYAICEDRDGTVWVGNAWSVFVANKKDMQFKRMESFGFCFIYDIIEDSDGMIWVATLGNGVFKHNKETGVTDHYLHSMNEKNSLSSNSVSNIMEDSRGDIWLSTERGGLCKYNKTTNNFTSYSIADGLPDDAVYKILEDDKRNLWFGTNKGLVRFNPTTKECRVFTKNEGLPSNQFNYKSAMKDSSGKFYFGTLGGLIVFDPLQFQENQFVPPVYITRFTLFNHEVDVQSPNSPLSKSIVHTQKIELAHNQSNIGFDFISLSYTSPPANRYAYMMENIDNDWNHTQETRVSYAKLPPGKYLFKVKGSNNDGVWNNRFTSVEIVIHPPWWASTGAYIAYLLMGTLCIYGCIYWYKRRTEKRNREKQRLFEAEKDRELYDAKVSFFTDVAHELRTPLTLINGPIESLSEMKITDAGINRNIQTMKHNVSELLTLTNQLLDFRKVDANKFSLNISTLNISQFLRDIYVNFDALASRQKKKIAYIPSQEPIVAAVDKDGIQKVLNNLLSNALKFSDRFISIELSQEEDIVVIRINNDGAIIPEKLRERIFEPFFQLEKNRNAPSSSGIGLSLSKSLAELHQGTLHVEELDALNSFVLKIPVNQDKIEENNPADDNYITDEPSRTEISGGVILLVEDNVEMLAFIAERLSPDFMVIETTKAADALETIQSKNVDMIVSDVMMPEMDGFEFCRKVKSNIESSHIPIILLTAKNDLASKIQGLEMGADAYIEKPFSFEFLRTQIMALLNSRKRERDVFLQKPFLPINQMGMTKADEKLMNSLIDIIHENITDANLNVERLGEMACMSRSNFHRKIKALTGLSPIEFIRLIRMKRAAEIIQEGGYKSGDVGFLVGVNSPSYFIRLFQKQFGITPKEFEMKQFK